MIFKNRTQAGELLAEKLSQLNLNKEETIILAVPRGGVAVGAVLAEKLNMPLDIIVTRKIGAPGNPELALGAVDKEGESYLDENLIKQLQVSEEYLALELLKEQREALRREEIFRGNTPKLKVLGKTVVLVDDGLATGATMKAALNFLKKKSPDKIIVAVPVASVEGAEEMRNQADELVILTISTNFESVGQFYEYFPQVSDQEVIALIKKFD